MNGVMTVHTMKAESDMFFANSHIDLNLYVILYWYSRESMFIYELSPSLRHHSICKFCLHMSKLQINNQTTPQRQTGYYKEKHVFDRNMECECPLKISFIARSKSY